MDNSGMYEEFYGLSTRPFAPVPDPRFLFWSESHEFAFTMLRYAVMIQAPVTVMSGESGVGKTVLLRQLANEQPDNCVIGLVNNMREGRGDLLQWALHAFGQPLGAETPLAIYAQFVDFLAAMRSEGRRVMLFVDEAQNLGAESLEQVRMLSNLNTEDREAFQIVLSGQPELHDALRSTDAVKLGQRASFDFTLKSLTEAEVEKYIHYRMTVAGATREFFPANTCRLIYETTGGVPRSISMVCDLCLIYGYADSREVIDEELLLEFLFTMRDRGIQTPFTQERPSRDAMQ